jgi:hypothetical protein
MHVSADPWRRAPGGGNVGEPEEPKPVGDTVHPGQVKPSVIQVKSLELTSDHGLLKDCAGKFGWKNAGNLCPHPEWTPEAQVPVSHTMDIPVQLRLRLAVDGAAAPTIRGVGPLGMAFLARGPALPHGTSEMDFTSDRPLEKKIRKLVFPIRWSTPGEHAIAVTAATSDIMYVTMARPLDDKQEKWPEDGVTRKRMDRAVAWVEPLDTLDPHAIMSALMARFPFYSLHPSAKVPRQFKHPTFFNHEGGAWAMADYVEESGECQAIIRLLRGILRQLGVPGVAQILVTWADPDVGGGATPLHANLEETPNAGLDKIGKIGGKDVVAALVDGPVEEGRTYPASHSPMKNGRLSPGLNRYEACLEFTAGEKTRYYCGGAGVLDLKEKILSTFWGLVWVTPQADNGYRIEKIVKKY